MKRLEKTTKLNSKTQNHFTNEFLKYKLKSVTSLIQKHGLNYEIRNDGFGRATILVIAHSNKDKVFGTIIKINVKKEEIYIGQKEYELDWENDEYGMVKNLTTSDASLVIWGKGEKDFYMNQIDVNVIDTIIGLIAEGSKF